jgi:hypothetical protein
MPLPRELTVEQCKLLQKDELVERYQQLWKVLQTIEQSESLGLFAKRPAFAASCVKLDELAVRMSRDRYRIGFLGLSQAGKSTSVGCVVGAIEDEDNPAPPGGKSRAATAVATRIRPVREPHANCAPHEKHHVELIFLTARQFSDRLRDIFGILGLPFDDSRDSDAWLEQLAAHERENPREDIEDRIAAVRLIHAKKRFGDSFIAAGDEPVTRRGSFDLAARRSYVLSPPLNEPPSSVTEHMLLREMRVWYCTTAADFSGRLDLIDLPGLGVKRKSDDALTLAFLDELDGAFLFSTRLQLTGDEAATVTKQLRKRFGDTLSGRMWLVTTFMHEFEPSQLEDTDGTVKTLSDEITNNGFVRNNVVFASTNVYQALYRQVEGERNSDTAWDAVKSPRTFKPKYDGSGHLIYPRAIEAFPEFKEAYAGLAFDGGIARIRHLMTKNVEDEVRRQTQEHAVRVMNDAIQALSKDLAASRQMGGMSHEQMVDAAKAASAIEAIAEDLRRPNDRVDGLAHDIIESLGGLLEQYFEDRKTNPARTDGTSVGNALKRQGLVAASRVIPEVMSGLRQEIDVIAASYSAMNVELVRSAMNKWREYCTKWKTDCDAIVNDGISPGVDSFLYERFDGLQMPGSLADEMWSNDRGPTVGDYCDLMNKKIALVAHEFVARLAHELAQAVGDLSERIRSVANESAAANPAQVQSIKTIESELRQLQTT